VSPASINRRLACLKRMFNVARKGLIQPTLRAHPALESIVVPCMRPLALPLWLSLPHPGVPLTRSPSAPIALAVVLGTAKRLPRFPPNDAAAPSAALK
jgi:hypothetical protein